MRQQGAQAWLGSSIRGIGLAKDTNDAAGRQCAQSQKAHEEMGSGILNMYGALHSTLSEKVSNTSWLMGNLQRRAESLEDSIQKTAASMGRIQECLQATDEPLRLARWRMALRKERPPREKVRDVLEAALEEEEAVILETRRRLIDAGKRTSEVQRNLMGRLGDVRHDMELKQQALDVDERCLDSTHGSHGTMRSTVPLGATPRPGLVTCRLVASARPVGGAPAAEEARQANNNELVRQRRAAYLDRLASDCEEDAENQCNNNAEVIALGEHAIAVAAARCQQAVQERMDAVEQVRSRLEDQVQELDARISQTTDTIEQTDFHIKALDEPRALGSTCSVWRSTRLGQEHIEDPVSLSLRGHDQAVQAAAQELLGHHRLERTHLKQLQVRRARLLDDLGDKITAQRIDAALLSEMAPAGFGGDWEANAKAAPRALRPRPVTGAPGSPPGRALLSAQAILAPPRSTTGSYSAAGAGLNYWPKQELGRTMQKTVQPGFPTLSARLGTLADRPSAVGERLMTAR